MNGKALKLDLNKSVVVQHLHTVTVRRLLSVTVVFCILHLPKPKPEAAMQSRLGEKYVKKKTTSVTSIVIVNKENIQRK